MAEEKTFYLLRPFELIKESDAPSWLGRVVKNFQKPSASFTPADTSGIIGKYEDISGFANVNSVLSQSKSSSLKIGLFDGLGFSRERKQDHTSGFQTSSIRRLRVGEEDLILQKLLENAEDKAKIIEWSPVFGRPACLVVGLLIGKDVTFDCEIGITTSGGGQLSMPAGVIASAAAAVPLPISGNLGLDRSQGTSRNNKLQVTVQGDWVIAVEYRTIRWKTRFAQRRGMSLEQGPQGNRSFSGASESYEDSIPITEVFLEERPPVAELEELLEENSDSEAEE